MFMKKSFGEKESMDKGASLILKGPEKYLSFLYKKIPRYIKLTFVAGFLLGLAAHFYAFSRKLPNHDDIGHLFGSDYGAASGRWFLAAVLKLDGDFSTPWLIGILSLIMLSLSCCFVVSVLGIRSPLGCVLTAGVMVTFPSVTATICYMFSADAYFFSLALSCFAAYSAVSFRYGFIPAIAAIVLSMSIYQSYFGVTAFLLLGFMIFGILDGRFSVKDIWRLGIKFFLLLLGSMLAYLLTVKLSTRQTELVDYMGISNMGTLSSARLPELIKNAYFAYKDFFITNTDSVHPTIFKYAFLLCGVFSTASGIVIMRWKKRGAGSWIFIILLTILYPLAGNLIHIMVQDSPIHTLMIYGMTCIPLFFLALMSRCTEVSESEECEEKPWGRYICGISGWVIALTIALSCYGYTILSNGIYLKMEISYEQAYSYSTRLMSAVESAEGYDKNTPIIILGEALEDIDYEPSPELNRLNLTGDLNMKDILNSYSYNYFLRYFIGSTNIVYLSDSEYAAKYEEKDEVKYMPEYPAQGSIRLIDDMLIVKLS
jgi:hypothetical protein